MLAQCLQQARVLISDYFSPCRPYKHLEEQVKYQLQIFQEHPVHATPQLNEGHQFWDDSAILPDTVIFPLWKDVEYVLDTNGHASLIWNRAPQPDNDTRRIPHDIPCDTKTIHTGSVVTVVCIYLLSESEGRQL